MTSTFLVRSLQIGLGFAATWIIASEPTPERPVVEGRRLKPAAENIGNEEDASIGRRVHRHSAPSDLARFVAALEAAAVSSARQEETVTPQNYLQDLWLQEPDLALAYMASLNDLKVQLSAGPRSCSPDQAPFKRLRFDVEVVTSSSSLTLTKGRFTVVEGAPLSRAEEACLSQILHNLAPLPWVGKMSKLPPFPFDWTVDVGSTEL